MECQIFFQTRVWNPQFTTYAGYKIDDKTVIGDRNQIEFTQVMNRLF